MAKEDAQSPSGRESTVLGTIPLIRLEGLREVTVERSPCSLVFQFRADDGRRIFIRIVEFAHIVSFLQSEGAIPELPLDWVHQLENDYGFGIRSAAL